MAPPFRVFAVSANVLPTIIAPVLKEIQIFFLHGSRGYYIAIITPKY